MNAARPSAILILAFLITACASRPHAITPSLPAQQPGIDRIFIVNHGWHTGFVVNAADMFARLPMLQQRFPAATQLEFGWGDRAFYQSEDFSAGLALHAMLWPSATVMHVAVVPQDVQRYFAGSAVREVCLNTRQRQALLQFLASSFGKQPEDQQTAPGRGLYGDSQFYHGAGKYHLFNTCNNWTARGLQSAGFDITPAMHLTADGILRFLDRQQSHRCTPPPGSETTKPGH